MISPSLPRNEDQRLQVLYDLLLLDTPPEERFDRIVEFASTEFDVPICLISLVDRDRQWFKAKVGLDACETSRDISFCAHAILESNDLLIVMDAHADQRFHDNPLVTGAPHIRFYAGVPLVMDDGLAIGTLCLIDTVPRTLDDVDQAILRSLRDLLALELRSAKHDATMKGET